MNSLALIPFGPQMAAVGRVDQVHRQPDAFVGLPEAPLDQGTHVEPPGDLSGLSHSVVRNALADVRAATRTQSSLAKSCS